MMRTFVTKYAPALPMVEEKARKDDVFSRYGIFTPPTRYGELSSDQLVEYYKTVNPLKTAIDILARSVSATPIMMVNKKDNSRVDNHPLLDLLSKPNIAYQKTRKQLFKSIAFWKSLTGDCFIILTGRTTPLEMFVVRSQDVRVQLASDGFIEYYEYRNPQGNLSERYQRTIDGRYFTTDMLREMVHISELILDPSSNDQGAVSDAVALAREVEQYIKVTEHNIALLDNGGRPSGAFVLPEEAGQLDAKTRAELQAQINAIHSGAHNAGRPMLLEGGLEWKNFATSPKDGDYNATKADAEAQIFKAVGVPMELAGSSKNVSANNLVNIRREFYYSRVVPLMEDILEFLNSFVLPRYGKNQSIELQVDKEAIDVFIEDIAARRKLVEGSLVMTINEKRKLFRLPEIEGGDKIVDPNGRPIAGEDAGTVVGAVPTPLATPPVSG